VSKKCHRWDLNLQITDQEADTLTTQPPCTSDTGPKPLCPPFSTMFYDELSDLLDTVADVIDLDQFIVSSDANCPGVDSSSVCSDMSTLLDEYTGLCVSL